MTKSRKEFFIRISGTRVARENGTLLAKINSVDFEIIRSKIADAYMFANRQLSTLRAQEKWDDYEITVVETIPKEKPVATPKHQVHNILDPFLEKYWQGVLQNQTMQLVIKSFGYESHATREMAIKLIFRFHKEVDSENHILRHLNGLSEDERMLALVVMENTIDQLLKEAGSTMSASSA